MAASVNGNYSEVSRNMTTSVRCGASSVNASFSECIVKDPFKSRLEPRDDFIVAAILCVTWPFAVCFNGLVLCVGVKFWKCFWIIDILVLHLAVLDLGVTLVDYPMFAVSCFYHQWKFGRIGCYIYGLLGMQFGDASIVTLAVISLLRLLRFTSPATKKRITRKSAVWIVALIHVYVGTFSFAPFLGWSGYGAEQHGTSCTVDWRNSASKSYMTCLFLFAYFIPVVVMVTCYVMVVLYIRKNCTQKWSWMEKHMMRMTLLMSVAIIAAWTPYAVLCMWQTYALGPDNPWFSASAVLFAKLASVYNPLIYFFTSQKFQKQTLTFLCRSSWEPREIPFAPSLDVRKWRILNRKCNIVTVMTAEALPQETEL